MRMSAVARMLKFKEGKFMILTQAVLKKLDEVPLEVRLWNGNFNKCTVERTINRRHYRIEVQDSHPLVQQFVSSSVMEQPVGVWYNHRLINYKDDPVPEELLPLIDKMKAVCKMQEEQALEVYKNMCGMIDEFRRNFYGED